MNGNGIVDLEDAIISLQIVSGLSVAPEYNIYIEADVDEDGKISIVEAIHALQMTSGLRP